MAEPDHQTSRLEAISTRWSLLRQAHGTSNTLAGAARNALVLSYLPAMRRYIGALVRNDQDADDLTQDFVVRLLSGDFAGADPQRGRFRDLLKVAIRNMVRNRWSREKRRRGVDLDVAGAAAQDDREADQCWLAQWRQSVLDLAWRALEEHQRSRPGSVAYTVLRLRSDYPEDSSDQLAARLAEKTGRPASAETVRQRLRRARLQFADLLIAEVARGLHEPTPEKIEDELTALELMDFLRELLPPDWRSRQGDA